MLRGRRARLVQVESGRVKSGRVKSGQAIEAGWVEYEERWRAEREREEAEAQEIAKEPREITQKRDRLEGAWRRDWRGEGNGGGGSDGGGRSDGGAGDGWAGEQRQYEAWGHLSEVTAVTCSVYSRPARRWATTTPRGVESRTAEMRPSASRRRAAWRTTLK
jgi:hypothetical protein